MSFSRFRTLTTAFTLAVSLGFADQVEAQLFGSRCQQCSAPPVQPVAFNSFNSGNICAPQQVAYNPCNACTQQVVYRTVPVTEYQQVTQTVRKPIVETAYEDRQYTQYRTVYEQKTAQVPTVSYQNVTECQTVSRDLGRWVSYQQPIAKCSPCAYDSSPGLLGMMNRMRVQVRNAFTPSYSTQRQYMPNVVAQQVPVTRQVAVRGMQTVNYQVARLEPYTVTKQVAVQKVRYEDEQVVAMRPITSYRTVPIGTQTAFGFVPFQEGSGTVTAEAPTPDPISARKAEAPTPVPKRTATNDSKLESDKPAPKPAGGFNPFGAGTSVEPNQNPVLSAEAVQTVDANHSPASSANPVRPSMIRQAGWRARVTTPENSLPPSGPVTAGPSLQVVKATH